MYLSSSIGVPPDDTEPRRGPLPWREAMQLADRRLFDDYSRACAGVRILEVLRRDATDPIVFWERVIRWLPRLFKTKREGERQVREGRKSQTEIDETLRWQMRHVYPPGYALGTEQEELARAHCALAKARWRSQAARTPQSAPVNPFPLQGLGQAPAQPAAVSNCQASFTAERDITENHSAFILGILGGPSPWQPYLQRNLASHRRTLPAKPIRICDEREFAGGYRRVYGESAPADAQGFVDRRNGMMILKEFPQRSIGKSKLGIALHEAVHQFSHPPGRSNRIRATVYEILGRGLLEGLTQMVTDDILSTQCISPMRPDWQAYKKLTPIARKFMQALSPRTVADAYFLGAINPLHDLIRVKWTFASFVRLRELANREETPAALQLIDTLNRPREFQQIFRGSR